MSAASGQRAGEPGPGDVTLGQAADVCNLMLWVSSSSVGQEVNAEAPSDATSPAKGFYGGRDLPGSPAGIQLRFCAYPARRDQERSIRLRLHTVVPL